MKMGDCGQGGGGFYLSNQVGSLFSMIAMSLSRQNFVIVFDI